MKMDFKENIFTGEVSFYIDNHINCHKCSILKAEQQNELLIPEWHPKITQFYCQWENPHVNLNTQRNSPHITKKISKSGNKGKKNRKC